MELSIVIVSWNVAPLLAACLDSITAWMPDISYEVVVVDNASSDGSVEMLRTRFPAVTVIASDENLGFAGGVNRGVRACRGTFVWLLNPDTELMADSYTVLRSSLDSDRRVGIAGPRLIDTHGVAAMGAGGRFPGARSILNTAVFAHRLLPRARLARGLWLSFDERAPRRIDWVSGAAMLFRRETFDSVNGFDERFFLLCEDIDFCRRACDLGWQTRYVPETTVIHHEGSSIAQQDDELLGKRQASLRSYLGKRFGTTRAALLMLPLKASYLLRLMIAHARYTTNRSERNQKRLMLVRKHFKTMS